MLDRLEPGDRQLPSPATAASVLRVRGLGLRFGGLQVLADLDLDVERGAIHGLCGPNGAGKTSLFNCVSGLYRARSGTIELDGVDVSRRPAHALAGLGLARTFQHPCLDAKASVLDNVLVGAAGPRLGWVAAALAGAAGDAPGVRARAIEALEAVGLAQRSTSADAHQTRASTASATRLGPSSRSCRTVR